MLGCESADNKISVSSPDGENIITLKIKTKTNWGKNVPVYSVRSQGIEIIKESPLGLILKN